MVLSLPAAAHRLTWLLHALALGLGLSFAAMFYDKSLFSWHPTLMALGYLLFLTEGIITAIMFRPVVGESRVWAIYKHSATMWPGIACIAYGFYAIYQNKVNAGKDHFTTLHGKCGLATLALTVGAMVGGAVSFRKLGIITMLPASMHPAIKAGHRYAGTFVLLAALGTIEVALLYPSMKKGVMTPIWQGGVAALGLLVLVLSIIAKPQSDKTKTQ